MILIKSRQRILAEEVVDRVLTIEESSDADAGWRGCSVLERFMQGSRSPGGKAPDTVGRQAEHLTDWPYLFVQARDWMAELTENQQYALRIDRSVRGRLKVVAVDPFNPEPEKRVEIFFTDAYIAHRLGISTGTLRRRISDAYTRLIRVMERAGRENEKGRP